MKISRSEKFNTSVELFDLGQGTWIPSSAWTISPPCKRSLQRHWRMGWIWICMNLLYKKQRKATGWKATGSCCQNLGHEGATWILCCAEASLARKKYIFFFKRLPLCYGYPSERQSPATKRDQLRYAPSRQVLSKQEPPMVQASKHNLPSSTENRPQTWSSTKTHKVLLVPLPNRGVLTRQTDRTLQSSWFICPLSSSDGFLEDPWKPLGQRSQISSQILRKSCCPKLSKIWLYDLYALFRMSGLGRIWDEFGTNLDELAVQFQQFA